MLSGRIQKIRKDHSSWLKLIDEFQREIARLTISFQSSPSLKNSNLMNELLHHERILKKLQTTIQSHRVFINEFAHEPGVTAEFLDFEGHERNHQHLLNFEGSFRKMTHHIQDSPSHERAFG